MTISTQTALPEVLTVAEAGQLLRISRQSAYQAARTGELPTVKIGRRVLVPRRALEEMLSIEDPQNEVAPAGNGRDATTSTDAAGPRDDAIVTA